MISRKVRRRCVAGTVAAGLAVTPFFTTAEPVDAHSLGTALDGQVLQSKGKRMGPTGFDPAFNYQAAAYCAKVGIGTNNGQCQMTGYVEEVRESVVQDYREQASPDKIYGCDDSPVQENLGWAETNTATHTVGGSFSLAVATTFGVKPFGVGGNITITATATASYSYAWGTASTQQGSHTMSVNPGQVGWWDWAKYHGKSHGIVSVDIPIVKDGNGLTVYQTGRYQFPMHIDGDLPRPDDPSLAALQPVLGLTPHKRMMTASERAACTPVSVATPDDQTSMTDEPVSLQIQASSRNEGTLEFTATGLPDGLSINKKTGLISGAPTTPELTTVGIKVTDSQGEYNILGTSFKWRVKTPASPPPNTSTSNPTSNVYSYNTRLNIPDTGSPVTAPVTVHRDGYAPADLKVDVDIWHTYRGDLVIDLISPDGTAYRLKDDDGNDAADNVKDTYTLNTASEKAGGTWKLRIRDVATGDVGWLNGWRITF